MTRGVIAALALSACAVDPYGVRAPPVILRQLARARADGSLACAYYFVAKGPGDPFAAQCSYDREERVCSCRNEETRAGRPLFWQPEEYKFTAPVCAWLPEGLDWPPSTAYALATGSQDPI